MNHETLHRQIEPGPISRPERCGGEQCEQFAPLLGEPRTLAGRPHNRKAAPEWIGGGLGYSMVENGGLAFRSRAGHRNGQYGRPLLPYLGLL